MNDANERHITNYDNEDSWHIDAYDAKSRAILKSVGATMTDTHRHCASYDCTAQQLIEYIAALHDINVTIRQRKAMCISDDERAKRRERMTQINARRMASCT